MRAEEGNHRKQHFDGSRHHLDEKDLCVTQDEDERSDRGRVSVAKHVIKEEVDKEDDRSRNVDLAIGHRIAVTYGNPVGSNLRTPEIRNQESFRRLVDRPHAVS